MNSGRKPTARPCTICFRSARRSRGQRLPDCRNPMARAATKEKDMETANVVLDMKGLSCPKPLIGAKRMVDELAAGQILLLVSDCPGTKDDLFAWAKQTGNQILK